MPEKALAVTASELLDGITAVKSRPPWPAGVPMQPKYEGGPVFHPVDKKFISQAEAVTLGAKPLNTAPKPGQPTAPATASPAPVATAEPKPEPQQHEKSAPDFSSLPDPDDDDDDAGADDDAELHQETPQQSGTMEDQRTVAEFLFNMFVSLMMTVFGDVWRPETAAEAQSVINATMEYLHYVGATVLTPLQKLWVAYGTYSLKRIGSIIGWVVNRFKKKSGAAAEPERTTRSENAEKERNVTSDEPTIVSGDMA